jgi:hypothetical protein
MTVSEEGVDEALLNPWHGRVRGVPVLAGAGWRR